ncbi:MAG: DUF6111 family protein [Pseudolabrys sp.]|jgi:heme/copper-type cytochrome/quinol oxidase subunit 3
MIRTIATELALFATPFALYAIFLWATKAGVLDAQSWPVKHIIALAIVALLLVIGSFVYFAHYGGAAPGSAYVPAHLDDQGRFVPGTTR